MGPDCQIDAIPAPPTRIGILKIEIMKNLVKLFRVWRDKRFRERIDKIYFRVDERGNRYMDGVLNMTYDFITNTPANVRLLDKTTTADILEKHVGSQN